MEVYGQIAAVAAELASEGISKSRKNQQQGYAFRGIDEVYNALAPVLAKHKLVIVPRFVGRTLTERESKGGGALFNVVVEAEFDIVSAIDGSKHTARTFGEAMDSADKATNKAMSAAYKYAAFQTFCIPTEGDNDADATTHAVAPRRANVTPITAKAPAVDEVWDVLAFAAVLGETRLRSAWQQLPEAERKRISETRSQDWADLKAKAAKVGA